MLKKLLALVLMLIASVAMAAVDVNKATEAQLDGIKGIGPVTSKMIMAERKKGDFKSWEDFVERVKGVGDSRAAKLSAAGLTVNGTAFKGAAAVKKDEKAAAKSDKKDAKAAAKEEKAIAKEEKKDAKVAAAPAASAAKTAASAPKPAASAKK
ncbi:MAG: helix-hairpin-helix domain-containing protein [Ramlibacter sp.]|nr:helix-hairpin-helix domain-containing protein [Ramlibacter sp.]